MRGSQIFLGWMFYKSNIYWMSTFLTCFLFILPQKFIKQSLCAKYFGLIEHGEILTLSFFNISQWRKHLKFNKGLKAQKVTWNSWLSRRRGVWDDWWVLSEHFPCWHSGGNNTANTNSQHQELTSTFNTNINSQNIQKYFLTLIKKIFFDADLSARTVILWGKL